MKNKKAKAAKKNAKATGAGKSLKKAGKGIARFATSKKGIGVLALVTLGLSYLAKRRNRNQVTESGTPDDQGAE
jgi:hypothetical protein